MALADFIQSLQEPDIVYSTPPQPSIRVIPPEQHVIKIIPPETITEQPQTPKVIKLKIKPKVPENNNNNNNNQTTSTNNPIESNNAQPIIQTTVQNNTPLVTQPQVQPIIQSSPENHEDIPVYRPKPNVETISDDLTVTKPPVPEELTDDDIFNSTGTEYSKKDLWLDYYKKAKTSRKSNPIVDRMKLGRFTITPDNKVLLLPDYDIVGKDPDDVLKDKWF